MEPALHTYIKYGSHAHIEILIEKGSDLSLDLSLLNNDGNTALHTLIDCNIDQPEKEAQQIAIYHTIVKLAPIWCRKLKSYPISDDCDTDEVRRKAVLYLTSAVPNKEGLNVVSYAAKRGAVAILNSILITSDVYKFQKGNDIMYDVTNFAPETVEETNDNNKNTLIRIVVSHLDETTAGQILQIPPVKYMMSSYGYVSQWFFFVLMVFHIIYMTIILSQY